MQEQQHTCSVADHCLQDIVTRYASQTGHHVSRRFGWDCHGLPVEQETEKLHSKCAVGCVCASVEWLCALAEQKPLAKASVKPTRVFDELTHTCLHTDLKGRGAILDMGISKFNEECRSIVMR